MVRISPRVRPKMPEIEFTERFLLWESGALKQTLRQKFLTGKGDRFILNGGGISGRTCLPAMILLLTPTHDPGCSRESLSNPLPAKHSQSVVGDIHPREITRKTWPTVRDRLLR